MQHAFEEELKIGDKIAGRYEIISVIGKGSMGVVYRGKHDFLGRIVAVKTLRMQRNMDDRSARRFEREARASAIMDHPNLVPVHDFGQTPGGQPYLVMDYVEGVTLYEVLKREKRLLPDRAVSIFAQVCDGLYHAHTRGVIHRDLKPANILLVNREGEAEFIKVVDLGVAKIVAGGEDEAEAITQTGEVCGSPIYLSPEQCMYQELDPRTDIYSLGVCLYETLLGIPPLRGATVYDTIYMHVHDTPKPFSAINPDHGIPPKMEAIVHKCLAKNPNDRFETMLALKNELVSVLRKTDAPQINVLAPEVLFSERSRPQQRKLQRPSMPRDVPPAALSRERSINQVLNPSENLHNQGGSKPNSGAKYAGLSNIKPTDNFGSPEHSATSEAAASSSPLTPIQPGQAQPLGLDSPQGRSSSASAQNSAYLYTEDMRPPQDSLEGKVHSANSRRQHASSPKSNSTRLGSKSRPGNGAGSSNSSEASDWEQRSVNLALEAAQERKRFIVLTIAASAISFGVAVLLCTFFFGLLKSSPESNVTSKVDTSGSVPISNISQPFANNLSKQTNSTLGQIPRQAAAGTQSKPGFSKAGPSKVDLSRAGPGKATKIKSNSNTSLTSGQTKRKGDSRELSREPANNLGKLENSKGNFDNKLSNNQSTSFFGAFQPAPPTVPIKKENGVFSYANSGSMEQMLNALDMQSKGQPGMTSPAGASSESQRAVAGTLPQALKNIRGAAGHNPASTESLKALSAKTKPLIEKFKQQFAAGYPSSPNSTPFPTPTNAGGSTNGALATALSAGNSSEYLAEGRAAFNRKDYAKAVAKFRQVLIVHPGDSTAKKGLAVALYNQAVGLANRENFNGAREKLQESLEVMPDYSNARRLLGEVESRLGQTN